MDMSQLSFANAAMSIDRDALEDSAEKIRVALRAAGHQYVV
jgi:hypothetical protein